MKNQISIDEIHEYLKSHWYSEESWTDFNLAIDLGFTEYAAYLIYSAGAINSKLCYEDSKPIEKAIEKLMSNYGTRKQNKDCKKLLKNCFIASCNKCNSVSFVSDGNENLYPSLKTECWDCGSKNIELNND